MKLLVTKATTSKIVLIFIQDSSSTTGAGLTGLLFNSAGLTAFFYREGQGTGATAITLATMTIGTYATGGFVEIDAADMPGWYELSLPDAVLATGVDYVGVQLKGATNMAQLNIEIQLTDFDVNDVVRGGLTALPNAAAEAAGGLYTRGTGAGQINQDADGRIDANLAAWLGLTPAVLVSTFVQTDLQRWRGATPADLAINRVVTSVASMQANVLDAAAIASGALTSTKYAANAITAAVLATDAINKIRDAILSDATTFAGANIDAAITTRATPAQVNTEVLDVMTVDLFATPGAEVPTTVTTILKMVSLLYKAFINEVQQTGSEYRLLNNAGTVVDQKATVDDDGSKFTRGKLIVGP